jgi:F-type H+-transporting ATPase subunit b
MPTVLAGAVIAAAAAAKDAGEKASGGLPQLNVLDFSPQLIWLAITFLVLYFLMSKLTLPRVGEVLQERADRISKDLAEAQRLKGETEKAIATYEQAMAEARGRAQKIAQENRDRLNAEISKERTEVEARIAAKTADAERSIAAAKAQAMGQVNEIATDTAKAIVAELIGKTPTSDEIAKILAR